MNASTLYSPRSDENPWYVLKFKTDEEWLQIAQWYPFSVRCLLESQGRWLEVAGCPSRDQAYHVMKALSAAQLDAYYVVVQKLRYGKVGREKAILFAPRERSVMQALEAARSARRS